MDDGVQPFPRRGVPKDDLRERRAIQAVVTDDRRPHARDLPQTVASGRNRFARKTIRIDDIRTQRFENARDLAFAGSNSAG
jgi:hypothetical protein